MIKAPTDAELRAFAEAASQPGYMFPAFDIRHHDRCVFGHVLYMRGNTLPITDDVARQMESAVWTTRKPRLIRLIGVERKPSIKPDYVAQDVDKRIQIGQRFTLADAVSAVNRYFDPSIEESAIWPWAARGFKNISRWATT